MPMRCHDNSQCSDRSPVSQPVHIPPGATGPFVEPRDN